MMRAYDPRDVAMYKRIHKTYWKIIKQLWVDSPGKYIWWKGDTRVFNYDPTAKVLATVNIQMLKQDALYRMSEADKRLLGSSLCAPCSLMSSYFGHGAFRAVACTDACPLKLCGSQQPGQNNICMMATSSPYYKLCYTDHIITGNSASLRQMVNNVAHNIQEIIDIHWRV